MKIALKGSPQWSIDGDGVMSIQTTWICYQDNTSDNVIMGWLQFQNEVEEFAGDVGDAYKMPKSDQKSKDVTEYIESELFTVQDVSYAAADGRTHYEVTFTNIQNHANIQRIGGITAAQNENNERTKSARYRVNIGNTAEALDGFMDTFASGKVGDWAGASYLIESTEYAPVAGTLYDILLTAKDMSYMMIGIPSVSTDNFGNKTVKAVWRYSAAAFNEDSLPKQGDDASDYIGNREGFIIQEVSCENVGVLGYNVTITAVSQRNHTRISSTRRDVIDNATGGFYTEWESNFQAEQPLIESIKGQALNDIDVHDYIPEGMEFEGGTVRDVSFNERVTGSYDVSIRMSNQQDSSNGGGKDSDYANDWSAQVSQHTYKLTLEEAGWAKAPSGEPYMINFPPTTKFAYTMSPNSLIEMLTSSATVTPTAAQTQVLDAIRTRGTIGFDTVSGVQGFVNGQLKWFDDKERASINTVDAMNKRVQTIMMEGFVHAQPTMTSQGQSLRRLIFRPWTKKKCPFLIMMDSPDEWMQTDGRDWAVTDDGCRDYKWQYHEISVTMHYKKNIKSALVEPNSKYYKDAVKKIMCSNYTSYMGGGISFASSRQADSYGDVDDYTEVTCTIAALLDSNAYKVKWNPLYYKHVFDNKTGKPDNPHEFD